MWCMCYQVGMLRELSTITLLLIMSLYTQPSFAGDSISLTTGEWPPYFSEDFKHGGFGTRVTTEAFRLAGIYPEYTYLPWKRAYNAVLHAEHDGTVAWRRSVNREKLFHFSAPIFSEGLVFFYRKDLDFDWTTLDDVGHLTIGATLGYLQVELLKPIAQKMGGKLEIAPSDAANFQKLVRGRIDIFSCSEQVGRYLLQTMFTAEEAAKVRVHPKPHKEGSLHLLIPKSHPNGEELINRFNQGLEQLRKSGRYTQYLEESKRGEYIPEIYRLLLEQKTKSIF